MIIILAAAMHLRLISGLQLGSQNYVLYINNKNSYYFFFFVLRLLTHSYYSCSYRNRYLSKTSCKDISIDSSCFYEYIVCFVDFLASYRVIIAIYTWNNLMEFSFVASRFSK